MLVSTVLVLVVAPAMVASVAVTGKLTPNASSSLLDMRRMCRCVCMLFNLFRLIRLFSIVYYFV